ncbi:MAG: peptidylprolyl isomerase [Bacteroidales bacterium]|jgi:peptidyl-prolyl cis-trans isomerase SurA
MKKVILISLVCLLNTNLFAQTNVLDKVVAVVGKNMIKLSELETSYLQQKQNMGIIDEPHNSKCEILEGLLVNKLMLHQANIDSISITEEEVNREMDRNLRQTIKRYGSKENLERQMNKTLGEIKEYYKDITKENILISKIQENLTEKIKITPKDVSDFFNNIPKDSLPTVEQEYEFAQIVKIPTISSEEKELIKDRLNGYRERILKGDKFSTLASLYSEDPASAKKGGELTFSRGDMVSEFESVAFSLRDGEISPIFETKYGFHILQLIERKGDQVKCRHILIIPTPSNIELMKTKTTLDSISKLITDNKISFEDAVKTFSDDASKLTGGVMINPYTANARFSNNNINEIMQNIDKVDFEKYNQGNITEPTLFKAESGNAYRLIKITTKTKAHKINLIDDYDKIYTSALETAKTNAILEWANKRAPKTYIKIDNEYKDCHYKINWINK